MGEKLTLLQKLNKIYKDIDHIEKRGKNKSQGYNYVKAADLAHAVRNAFAELGIYAEVTFTQLRGYEFETSKGTKMQAADVECNIYFRDAEGDTAVYQTRGLGSGSDTTDKAVYKAQTGALKYALRNAFIVPDEADPENDSEEVTEEVVEVPKAVIPKFVPPKTVKKEESVASKATPVPTDSSDDRALTPEEITAFKNNCKLLVADLITAGLKPSKGFSHEKKLLTYILSETGAQNFESLTRNQLTAFEKTISRIKTNDGTKALVAEVNTACGIGENK